VKLVSCIMPTANRRAFVPSAIRLFLAQDYPEKELLIIDDGTDAVADLIPAEPSVRYIRCNSGLRLGRKRNLACEAARGEIVVHWDDDDWYAPWRLTYQVEKMVSGALEMCGLDRAFFVDPAAERAWEYVYRAMRPAWLCGATLCYTKAFWSTHRFPEVNVGEDSRFVLSAANARIASLDDNRFFIARIHAGNSSPKRPHARPWEPRPFDSVRAIVGSDWEDYFGGDDGQPLTRSNRVGTALITAASGIGDILRVTPLVRVVDRLSYEVDVLLAPDDVAAAELLRGASLIRRLFVVPPERHKLADRPIPDLQGRQYDLATFTHWSAPLGKNVSARRRYTFGSHWRSQGDIASLERIARELGWQDALPAPFAMKSARRFDLPQKTVAFHPGCKPNWPWKRWHGFEELASLFPSVAVVGTEADLDNSRTYFARPFQWPENVRDFTGKLDLRDTSALISQCSALISVDSGLMHLGVALRVPTFGIFGITNPQRECIPSPFMVPVSKQLSCEPACRRGPWGRRDCERHLDCLKTLTPAEVAARVEMFS
jgi:ADP-heptose:LPS heptosyltransferase